MKKIQTVLMAFVAFFLFSPAFAATSAVTADPHIGYRKLSFTGIDMVTSAGPAIVPPRSITIAIVTECIYQDDDDYAWTEYHGYVVTDGGLQKDSKVILHPDSYYGFINSVAGPLYITTNYKDPANRRVQLQLSHTIFDTDAGLHGHLVGSAKTSLSTGLLNGAVEMTVASGTVPQLTPAEIEEVCSYDNYYNGKGLSYTP